jgi:hypothetical protein
MTTRAPRKPDIEHPGETDMFSRHRPSYSSYCRHCMADVHRRKTINALYLSLKQFGYTTLTVEETEAAYDLAMVGPVDKSGDIIAMLIRSQLEQAGVVS